LFSPEHIQTIARFDPGERFQAPRIEDLRRALVATGLVSVVNIRPVARPGSDIVDIAVGLEPAPVRTVAGEAGYGTGEGARVELSWEHRNLIPPEGAVRFRGVLGTEEQLIGASLRRNNFRRRDQVLTANIAASNIDRDAYNARTFLIGAGLERQTNIIWQKKWTWSVGADLITSDERDVNVDLGMTRRRTFFIAALPATLSYDGSNDLLDPTRGYRLAGRISPELSLQSGTFGYTRAQIDGSFYQPITESVTIAARARLGTIFGADRDRIAPSRRFYAGGGGSVRGYGFQRLGPRDPVFDDPIGGRSLTEFALEARVRVGGPFGVVPFLDTGNIYTSPLPRLDDLRLGAGIGVRYHSNFGPIRVDVGTPLSRRSGDPRIAVYVSLGQAF
jgi:translocation and assembly module TamA